MEFCLAAGGWENAGLGSPKILPGVDSPEFNSTSILPSPTTPFVGAGGGGPLGVISLLLTGPGFANFIQLMSWASSCWKFLSCSDALLTLRWLFGLCIWLNFGLPGELGCDCTCCGWYTCWYGGELGGFCCNRGSLGGVIPLYGGGLPNPLTVPEEEYPESLPGA